LKAEELYNEGNVNASFGKFEVALSMYEKAISFDRSNPMYFNNRAATLKRLERFEEAIDQYEEITRKFPQYGKAFLSIGSTNIEIGEYQAAVSAYREFDSAFRNGKFEFNPIVGGIDQTLQGSDLLQTVVLTSINYLSPNHQELAIQAFQAAINGVSVPSLNSGSMPEIVAEDFLPSPQDDFRSPGEKRAAEEERRTNDAISSQGIIPEALPIGPQGDFRTPVENQVVAEAGVAIEEQMVKSVVSNETESNDLEFTEQYRLTSNELGKLRSNADTVAPTPPITDDDEALTWQAMLRMLLYLGLLILVAWTAWHLLVFLFVQIVAPVMLWSMAAVLTVIKVGFYIMFFPCVVLYQIHPVLAPLGLLFNIWICNKFIK